MLASGFRVGSSLRVRGLGVLDLAVRVLRFRGLGYRV